MKNKLQAPIFYNEFSELAGLVPMSSLDGPYILDINNKLANELDLSGLDSSKWLDLLSGELSFSEKGALAFVYCGHQFGIFAGRLGDGRAHIIGELNGFELQLKGAGKTPFSRMGDGRAVLRSSVREYLASEFMNALSIPTTRALGIIGSKTQVRRETLEQGAIVCRVSPSFIRFGTFEYLYATKQSEEIDRLISFISTNYFDLQSISREEFFVEVIKKNVSLISKWMAYGFCHGVLNTDNMSILGLSLDYGPYGFLEELDPSYICNHSDHQGRYRYEEQPAIFTWNLSVLGMCLELSNTQELIEANFPESYKESFFSLMARRFQLRECDEANEFIARTLDRLTLKADLNIFLYELEKSHSFEVLDDNFKNILDAEWFDEYQDLRLTNLHEFVNPRYILWNWVTKKIIDECEKNPKSLGEFREIFQNPFEINSKWDEFLLKRDEQLKKMIFSCSS